jgi:CO dehydrogenase/acetyl-CoA synthase delta subunit
MQVCGVDFSGALNPAKGINYAVGNLENSCLTIVACASMAQAIVSCGLDSDWDVKHGWITDNEWEARCIEGLIIR